MDKSIKKKKNLLTPEKAATFIPIFISSAISILVFIFFVMPQYNNSNKVSLELDGLIKKKNDLDNLKSQYKIINKKFDALNAEKIRIIELITGASKLDTLLSKLGEIGSNNNIKFSSITPKVLSKYSETSIDQNTSKNDDELNVDPLLVEGTKKYEIEFNFNSEFVNLLAFLRELEFQDNVILINDIKIKGINQNETSMEIDNPNEVLQVKISMIFYGKT